MHLLDWLLVLTPMAIVAAATVYTHRYLKSVVDFLSGGRLADAIFSLPPVRRWARAPSPTWRCSSGSATAAFPSRGGAISPGPIGLVFGIIGFVTYRYRQTRAMTLAQFF